LSKLGKGSVFVVGALTALSVAVTGAFGGPATQSATSVAVTAGKPSEFKFIVKPKTVKKGVVTFKVANKGTLAHDFKIAGKKTKQIAKGKTATLRITFKKAGKYAYLCTLPSHAAAGMKGVLVVK
jgi:uncharacterized cupredoxin-like copper-binding protein